MNIQPTFAPRLRFLAAFVAAACLASAVNAQTSPAPAAPAQSAAPAADVNAAFLAKAGKLYYSFESSRMKGFDCAVHPDWRGLLLSAKPGAAVADDDAKVLLLKAVAITLHGRLAGGSTLDWNLPEDPEKPLDADLKATIEDVHKATDQTLIGFMQFWSPFVNGSVIPASPDGLEIANTDKGHTLHAGSGSTSITEILGNDLVLQQFNVETGGTKINFAPRYKPTDQGLLANGFLAHIQPPGTTADQAEEMHVEIEYQTVSGFPIPAKINVDVVGQAKFNFALDGCTVVTVNDFQEHK